MLWVFTVEISQTHYCNSKHSLSLSKFTVENSQNINSNSKWLDCLLLELRKRVFTTVNAILHAHYPSITECWCLWQACLFAQLYRVCTSIPSAVLGRCCPIGTSKLSDVGRERQLADLGWQKSLRSLLNVSLERQLANLSWQEFSWETQLVFLGRPKLLQRARFHRHSCLNVSLNRWLVFLGWISFEIS